MRWLALDVGSKRVGVAVCDAEERVATPLAGLSFRGAAELAERVAELAAARDIGGLVVGVPRTRGGGGRGERRVDAVVTALRARVGMPVEEVDERGTTAAASAYLREAGVPRRRWEAVIDSLAARLILETFLDRRRGQGEARRRIDEDAKG